MYERTKLKFEFKIWKFHTYQYFHYKVYNVCQMLTSFDITVTKIVYIYVCCKQSSCLNNSAIVYFDLLIWLVFMDAPKNVLPVQGRPALWWEQN